ncbi:hypothetical protein HDU96_007903 [Phlyctochytrium bullatum]|nr:hypothetical protein HDU96_007903 [Phlyctochytrium bullatum]
MTKSTSQRPSSETVEREVSRLNGAVVEEDDVPPVELAAELQYLSDGQLHSSSTLQQRAGSHHVPQEQRLERPYRPNVKNGVERTFSWELESLYADEEEDDSVAYLADFETRDGEENIVQKFYREAPVDSGVTDLIADISSELEEAALQAPGALRYFPKTQQHNESASRREASAKEREWLSDVREMQELHIPVETRDGAPSLSDLLDVVFLEKKNVRYEAVKFAGVGRNVFFDPDNVSDVQALHDVAIVEQSSGIATSCDEIPEFLEREVLTPNEREEFYVSEIVLRQQSMKTENLDTATLTADLRIGVEAEAEGILVLESETLAKLEANDRTEVQSSKYFTEPLLAELTSNVQPTGAIDSEEVLRLLLTEARKVQWDRAANQTPPIKLMDRGESDPHARMAEEKERAAGRRLASEVYKQTPGQPVDTDAALEALLTEAMSLLAERAHRTAKKKGFFAKL